VVSLDNTYNTASRQRQLRVNNNNRRVSQQQSGGKGSSYVALISAHGVINDLRKPNSGKYEELNGPHDLFETMVYMHALLVCSNHYMHLTLIFNI
jgi:hypothetical protein